MEHRIFTWESLGDLGIGRPNLGPKMDVSIYRLMLYSMRMVLIDRFGESEARRLYQEAGRIAGMAYCTQYLDPSLPPEAFLAQLNQTMMAHEIGILHIEKADLEHLHLVLTISEDLDCSGLADSGTTVCDYDEGFVAGVLEIYTGKEFLVKEVDCWASGDQTCRFDVQVKA